MVRGKILLFGLLASLGMQMYASEGAFDPSRLTYALPGGGRLVGPFAMTARSFADTAGLFAVRDAAAKRAAAAAAEVTVAELLNLEQKIAAALDEDTFLLLQDYIEEQRAKYVDQNNVLESMGDLIFDEALLYKFGTPYSVLTVSSAVAKEALLKSKLGIV